jgi:hypothetical protein
VKECWTLFLWENFLRLVDYTGPLFRNGKAASSAGLRVIIDRLDSSAESWHARLEKLKAGSLSGRFFASSRKRLRVVAAHPRLHHIANLCGCPAR